MDRKSQERSGRGLRLNALPTGISNEVRGMIFDKAQKYLRLRSGTANGVPVAGQAILPAFSGTNSNFPN
jgi:hypothetical protein